MGLKFKNIKKWILFGRGTLCINSVKYLKEKNQDVIIVCGKRNLNEVVGDKCFEELIKYNAIECYVSDDINKDKNIIKMVDNACIGVSLDAPWIFKKNFIQLFNGKLINSHGARLPQDRGGGGLSWRIMRNERTGYSILHQIDTGVDTGNIIKYKEYIFPEHCRTPIQFMEHATNSDDVFLKEFYSEVLKGVEFRVFPQSEYLSMYWPRLHTDTHGFIDWSWKRSQIENFICAFDDPYNGASTFIKDIKVRLKKCYSSVSDGLFHPFQYGIVYRKNSELLFIAVDGGSIIVKEVINDNGENVSDAIKVGDRFVTPCNVLLKAKEFRAIYNSNGLKGENSENSEAR